MEPAANARRLVSLCLGVMLAICVIVSVFPAGFWFAWAPILFVLAMVLGGYYFARFFRPR